MSNPIFALMTFAMLAFEVTLLVVAWRRKAVTFAAYTFDQNSHPRRFWAIFGFNAAMVTLISIVLLYLIFGIHP